ncbi:MAG TPA: PRC and DUF2382 domain-containing protein [Actinoplanes sp.]|jgi:uncharacterized protein (TIGR02271 family)
MITQEQVGELIGRDVYDRDGDKIGSVGQIWGDAAGRPTWASVRTGFFGINESLVPLQDADVAGDRLVVPFEKSQVKDAPNIDAAHDEPLTQDEVDRLYQHYGMSWDDSYDADTVGQDTSGPTADDAMTRSEERLNVSTERQQVGRARLRKYIVTENQTITVPVRREEVRLEREPITGDNVGEAYDGPDITEAEAELTLHAERPVITTETVPVERVRIGKETVTEQETVAAEVRKEQIEADLPDEGRRTL